jgi:uncharacterized protein YgiM (DUF1202 family)
MRRRVAATVLIVLAAACAAPPPPPSTVPDAAPAAAAEPAEAGEVTIGTVRVTATTLNVRAEPSTTATAIAQLRKGERLPLLAAGDEWMKVRLASGEIGWVAKQHVARESGTSSASSPRPASNAPATRPRNPRGGCEPDRNYSFIKAPTPSFTENGAHGVVTVEANVDKNGIVQSTRIVANTTGDEALGFIAEREIKGARFAPPVRGCVPKAFIFTYKRSF